MYICVCIQWVCLFYKCFKLHLLLGSNFLAHVHFLSLTSIIQQKKNLSNKSFQRSLVKLA